VGEDTVVWVAVPVGEREVTLLVMEGLEVPPAPMVDVCVPEAVLETVPFSPTAVGVGPKRRGGGGERGEAE